MKTRLLLLTALLLALAGCALADIDFPADLTVIEDAAFEGDTSLTGVLTLPGGLTSVGSRAFAGTRLDALIFPADCQQVGAGVLSGPCAAYLYLKGAETTLSGAPGTAFVFAPAGSRAASLGLGNFYPAECLTIVDGVYYAVTNEALPLCAVNRTRLADTVTVPKLVDGKPVTSLDQLYFEGWDDVLEVRVPQYLTYPSSLPATTYATMSVAAPVTAQTSPNAGDPVTWTTQAVGAYGEVTYFWTITLDGTEYSEITAVPEVTFTPSKGGSCTVSVRAVDALNDTAQATGQPVTIIGAAPVYRALLVGNTYPGTYNELAGCDTDVDSLKKILSSMDSTKYRVNAQYNLHGSLMLGMIASTFGDAKETDVSLFYFSGHGTTDGRLVGTGNSYVSPSTLRNALDEIPGTKIVILDCCFSGNFIGKSDGGSPSDFNRAIISAFSWTSKGDNDLAANGYYVITACTKEETSSSLSTSDISFGAFTYGVCYGSGYDIMERQWLGAMPADTNGDRAITIPETVAVVREWIATFSEWIGFPLEQSVQTYYSDPGFVLWQD